MIELVEQTAQQRISELEVQLERKQTQLERANDTIEYLLARVRCKGKPESKGD